MWQEGQAYATFQECEADRVRGLAQQRELQADLKKRLADPTFKKAFDDDRERMHRTEPEKAQAIERMVFGDHLEYTACRPLR